MIIYIARNLNDGLSYVGKTGKPLLERWKQHLQDARNGSRKYFHNAIRKYGESAFSLEIICECALEEADMLEKFCIAAFNTRSPNGYNMTDGGDGVPGYVFTEEDRKKLGSGLRGKKRPPRSKEWKEKLRQASIKNYQNPEINKNFFEGIKRRLQNEDWVAHNKELGRQRANNPIWKKKISEAIKLAYSRPEVLKNVREAGARRSAAGWSQKMFVRSSNPEWIKKQKEGSRKRSDSPEWKENHRKMCADPEYRKKLSIAQLARQKRIKAELFLADSLIQYVHTL